MRLLVRMSNPRVGRLFGRNGFRRRYMPDRFVAFETTVTRLIRGKAVGTIWAHGFMPDRYHDKTFEQFYNPDGTYTFEVNINHNAESLATFLASGLAEMDVTEVDHELQTE